MYAKSSLSFGQLLKACFVGYAPVLRQTWPLIVILSVLAFFAGMIGSGNSNWLLLAGVIVYLVVVYVYGMILHAADKVFVGTPNTLQQSVVAMKPRYLSFLVTDLIITVIRLVLLSFIALLLLTSFPQLGIAQMLNISVQQNFPAWSWIVFLIIGIAFIILLVYLYFAPALVVIDGQSIWASLKRSWQLVQKHWWRIFGTLLIIHLVMGLVFTIVDTIVPVNHVLLIGLRNFIRQLIVYPLLISTLLNLLNDLKLRTQ